MSGARKLHELQEPDEVASALQVTPRGRLRVYCHQVLIPFIALVVTGGGDVVRV